jgi:hypothetical protein
MKLKPSTLVTTQPQYMLMDRHWVSHPHAYLGRIAICEEPVKLKLATLAAAAAAGTSLHL